MRLWTCRPLGRALAVAALGFELAWPPAAAAVTVPLGGIARGVAVDPTRPVFFAVLSTRELVTIDIATSAVTGRVALPAVPRPLAIRGDGARAYVGLDTHDLAVVDLTAGVVLGVIDLSTNGPGPSSLGLAASFLYAISNDGISLVDLTMGPFGAEVAFDDTALNYDGKLATSLDGNTLYVVQRGVSPSSLRSFTRCGDRFPLAGEVCLFCIASGRDIAVSPDGLLLYVADSGSPYNYQIREAAPAHARRGSLLTGAYPTPIAMTRDGSRAYLGTASREVLVADLATRLPYASTLAGMGVGYSGSSFVLSPDERTLLAMGDSLATSVELIDVSAIASNRGGILARAIDRATGDRVVNAHIGGSVSDGSSDILDVPSATVGRAPLRAGTYSVAVGGPGYSSVIFSATVVAGEWTDLGEVALDRSTFPRAGPIDITLEPPLPAGATTTAVVHGRGFLPGATLASTDPELTIDAVVVRDDSHIDATVTLALGATAGRRSTAIRVTLPDGRNDEGSLVVASACSAPVRPPSPIPVLYCLKADLDVVLRWDDSPVDALHGPPDDYLAFRSVAQPAAGFSIFAIEPNSPAPRESRLDPGAISSAPPLSMLHFYRVSARNTAGDSGNLP